MIIVARRLWLTLLPLALAAALLHPRFANADPPKGTYATAFACSSAVGLGICQNDSPIGIAVGQQKSVTFTLTITNTSASGGTKLSTIDVSIPSGFTGVSATTSSAGLTVQNLGTSVRLMWASPGLAAQASSMVTMTATAPPLTATDVEDVYYWPTSVTQTNPAFTGNDPSTTVTAGPPTKLAFGQQLSAIQINKAVDPAVTVRVTDEFGALVKRYLGTITMGYGFNASPDMQQPSGNSAPAQVGTATFDQLKFATAGSNINLRATSQYGDVILQSDNSMRFDVWQKRATCVGSTCTSGILISPDGMTSAQVDAGSGSGGEITATVGDTSYSTLSCSDPYLAQVGAAGVTFNVSGDRAKTVTYTLSKAVVQKASKLGAPHFQICYASPNKFTAVATDGTLTPAQQQSVTVGSGAIDMYVGVLPVCKAKGLASGQPCLAASTGNGVGDRVFTIQVPPGDPRITS